MTEKELGGLRPLCGGDDRKFTSAVRYFETLNPPPAGRDPVKHFKKHLRKSFQLKTSTDLASDATQASIRKILRKLKVRDHDLDDYAQETLLKFIRLGFAESYNPDKSSWDLYLYQGVKNQFLTLVKRAKSRRMVSLKEELVSDNPFRYERDKDSFEYLLGQEVMADFRAFLAGQRNYRRNKREDCRPRWLAILKPPGTGELEILEPTKAVVSHIEERSVWVRLPGEKRSYLFPKSSILELRQPLKPIPHPEEKWHPVELLDLFCSGASREEIIRETGASNTILRSWEYSLEQLFCEWWATSHFIDPDLKYLGHGRVCPGCHLMTELPDGTYYQRARIVQINNKNHYKQDPQGVEVEAAWCPGCHEWALCRTRPGSALKFFLKGRYPWRKDRKKDWAQGLRRKARMSS